MEIIKFQLSKLTASKAVQASTWHVATMVVDLPASASALLWKYIMLTFHLSNIFENQKTWWENRFYIIILDIEWSWYIGKWHLTSTLSQQGHSLVGTLLARYTKSVFGWWNASQCSGSRCGFFGISGEVLWTDPSEDPASQRDSTKVLGKIWIPTSNFADIFLFTGFCVSAISAIRDYCFKGETSWKWKAMNSWRESIWKMTKYHEIRAVPFPKPSWHHLSFAALRLTMPSCCLMSGGLMADGRFSIDPREGMMLFSAAKRGGSGLGSADWRAGDM